MSSREPNSMDPQVPMWVGNSSPYSGEPMSGNFGAVQTSGPVHRFNFMDLLRGLLRHWVLALTLSLLCSGTAAAIAWTLTPNSTFTATSLIRCRTNQRSLLETRIDDERENRPFQASQATMVRRMTVIQTALENPKIAVLRTIRQREFDAAAWLQDELKVDFTGEIMRISLSGERGPDLVLIVNEITDAYLNKVGNQDKLKILKEIETLQPIQAKYAEQLRSKREQLTSKTRYMGTNNEQTLTLKGQLAIQQESDLKKELSWASIEKKKIEIEYNLKRNAPRGVVTAEAGPDTDLTSSVDHLISLDPQVQRLEGDLQKYEAAIERASGTIKNPQNDPSIKKARRELETTQQALTDRLALIRPRIEQQVLGRGRGTPLGDSSSDELSDLAQKLQFYSQYEKILKEQADKQSLDARLTNDTTTSILALQDEIASIQNVHDQISSKLERLKVDDENKTHRIELFERAVTARSPGSKRRMMMTIGAGLGTLALVLLGISFLEYRVRRIDSISTVSTDLGLRLVGALPATPSRPMFNQSSGQMAALDAYWRSRLNESVNAIRTMMLRQSQIERLQVVMVTSATVGEGKTSLSCHLATSLARAGHRTLLLDCDLRSPTAHRVYDLPLEPGLSDILRGQATIEEAAHPIALGELSMITAGRCDLHSLHALGLEQMSELVTKLRQSYDFIIIDTPPVLPVADTLLIGQHVDAALFSILREVSRVPKVYTACERLSGLGVKILGAVVAGARIETDGSDYYYTAAYAEDPATSASLQEGKR